MIYNKVTKCQVLAVEVDGYTSHKEGTKQHERNIIKGGVFKKYQLPLLRWSTNGSDEKSKILSMLGNIMQ